MSELDTNAEATIDINAEAEEQEAWNKFAQSADSAKPSAELVMNISDSEKVDLAKVALGTEAKINAPKAAEESSDQLQPISSPVELPVVASPQPADPGHQLTA